MISIFVLVLMGCRPSNQIGELVGVINERPLEGTVWLLIELNGKPIAPIEDQKSLFIIFQSEEKRVNGFGGCNSFTGSFTTSGSTINATLASTRMFCEGRMEVETEFMNLWSTSHKYKMEGSHLHLKNKGKIVAKFIAQIKTNG